MSTPEERLQSLYDSLTARWGSYPESFADQLKQLLQEGLEAAASKDPEVITVAGTATRPQVLRLAVLAKASSDDWYGPGLDGIFLLQRRPGLIVYCRRDGEHYAAPWSEGSALPEELMKSLPRPGDGPLRRRQ